MAGPGPLTLLTLPPSLASLERPDALQADALPGRPPPSHHRGLWALSLSQCGVSCAGLPGGQTRAFSTLAFQTPLGWVRLGRDRATLEGPGPLTCPLVMGYSPGGGGPSPVFGAWGREDMICYSAKFCNGCLALGGGVPSPLPAPELSWGALSRSPFRNLAWSGLQTPATHSYTHTHCQPPQDTPSAFAALFFF